MPDSSNGSTKLYHVDVYMPDDFKRPVFEGELFYTAHARREAHNDRYGEIPLPKFFEAAGAKLIEVETMDGRPIKQVWRRKLDAEHDLVLVIKKDGAVKTVWINKTDDEHGTL